jgi:hypothetical protein
LVVIERKTFQMNPKQPSKAFFFAGEGIAFFLQFHYGLVESPVEEKTSAGNPNDQKYSKTNPSKP